MTQLQELLTRAEHTTLGAGSSRPAVSAENRRIPPALAIIVAVLWAATLAITFGLEPAADPDAPVSALAIATSMIFMYAILTAGIGMLMRQRWGLAASLVGGIVMLIAAGTCLAGGHSGGWLVAQFVTGGLMTSVSIGALRAT